LEDHMAGETDDTFGQAIDWWETIVLRQKDTPYVLDIADYVEIRHQRKNRTNKTTQGNASNGVHIAISNCEKKNFVATQGDTEYHKSEVKNICSVLIYRHYGNEASYNKLKPQRCMTWERIFENSLLLQHYS